MMVQMWMMEALTAQNEKKAFDMVIMNGGGIIN
jgi:hypothetical protein